MSTDSAEHLYNNKIGSPWTGEAIRLYLLGNWIIELGDCDVDYFLNYQEGTVKTLSSSRQTQLSKNIICTLSYVTYGWRKASVSL